MTDLNKLRRLAGVPVDLSKVDNARGTIVTPTRLQPVREAAKVPQHRGELAPKNKKNQEFHFIGLQIWRRSFNASL